MSAPRLSLEGLPLDIATAITRFFLVSVDAGRVQPNDDEAFRATGARASEARADLVAAIKRHLATAPTKLPAADTASLGVPIETGDTDFTFTDCTFTELFGEPRPDPTLRPRATPSLEEVLQAAAPPEVAAFFADHPEIVGGARC